MKPEQKKLVSKHLPHLIAKLQQVIDESELKSFSIQKLSLTHDISHCPGGCPNGQQCLPILDENDNVIGWGCR